MKLNIFLQLLRGELDDNPNSEDARLWSDYELVGYIQEGQIKFCNDTLLLKKSFTVSLIAEPLTREYSLDPRIISVETVQPPDRIPLERKLVAEMNVLDPRWRIKEADTPRIFIPDADTGTIIFWPPAISAETETLTAYIEPLDSLFTDKGAVNYTLDMAIADRYLEGPKYWAKKCAYSKSDVETHMPQKADEYRQLYLQFVEDTRRKTIRTRGNLEQMRAHPGML